MDLGEGFCFYPSASSSSCCLYFLSIHTRALIIIVFCLTLANNRKNTFSAGVSTARQFTTNTNCQTKTFVIFHPKLCYCTLLLIRLNHATPFSLKYLQQTAIILRCNGIHIVCAVTLSDVKRVGSESTILLQRRKTTTSCAKCYIAVVCRHRLRIKVQANVSIMLCVSRSGVSKVSLLGASASNQHFVKLFSSHAYNNVFFIWDRVQTICQK